MQKKYKILLIVLLIIAVIIAGKWIYHDTHFVENNFKEYTGIKEEFIIRAQFYNTYESYIETIITDSEKNKLLKKISFKEKYKPLKSDSSCPFIVESADFVYYLNDHSYGPYGYILFALEKNGNTLKVYEMYGN